MHSWSFFWDSNLAQDLLTRAAAIFETADLVRSRFGVLVLDCNLASDLDIRSSYW